VTLHADTVRTLSAWTAPDAGQRELRDAYLSHLATYPDGMWREQRAAHITASALVIDPERGRVLLTLHRKLGLWLQMGGHCERQDTTLAGAALREATEESGIPGLRLSGEPVKLDRHEVPCAGRDHPPSYHLDVQYAAVAPRDAAAVISEESLDLRWFPYDGLPDETDTSVRELVARSLRGHREPRL
jgi:8-oxo-dGTP pyrophosphatase MutT (NUDIX family)